jgi:uncharacterized OB-fold protein
VSDREPVKHITTAIRLEYDYHPGAAGAAFLRGLCEGKLIGARAGKDGPVYIPPRGVDPKSSRLTDAYVEVEDTGTVVTFSITRVPSPNIKLDPPYIAISVLLDGAGLSFFHVLKGCDLEDARIGMRVKARWVPPQELGPSVWSIAYFEPLDEPDVPYDEIKDYC